MVLFDQTGDVFTLHDAILIAAEENRQNAKITTLTQAFAVAQRAKKVFDTQTMLVRTTENIERNNELECKSATALALSLLPNAQAIFIQQQGEPYYNHVAAICENMVIDLVDDKPSITSLKAYIEKNNVENFLIL